ncbi:huntingtin-like protein [Leptotrombidium deliense]|uniref:Huntingtin-like protein n=1 Tax=Leptotrombidium deliense TaxID=299467 RepID=A0A443SU62_9ACAR|nr:huntingtin-like protein [Leptotrombidium deliense]
MSSIEKLVKSFEALKVLQTTIDKPEEALVSTKFIKKETSLTKKDKISHCSTIAEIIISPQMRTIEDFHKFLGIAIETFLVCCDDNDSDVRLAASECLNKTIKSLLDSQLGRIQVELYKEIKKNGSSRSIRASLSRFADLCFLIRPTKCRPYLTNLLPCIIKISQRTKEDNIQETLGVAMVKLMRVFGRYATDGEIRLLMESFLPNLQDMMTSVRRTATLSLVSICQYSKKPTIFYSWLLASLLKLVNNPPNISMPSAIQQEQQRCCTLAGVFLCFKHLVPLLQHIPPKEETPSLKHFSLTVRQKDALAKELDNLAENLLQTYEILLHTLRTNTDHMVVLTALEALHQLLKTPPKLLITSLIDPTGIDKTRLGDVIKSSVPSSPCVSQKNLRMNASACSSMDNVSALEDDDEIVIKSLSGVKSVNLSFKGEILESIEPPSSIGSESEMNAVDTHDGLNSDVYEPIINYEHNSTQGTPIRFKHQKFSLNKLTYVESEENFSDGCFSPSTPSFGTVETDGFKVLNIGEFLDNCCTLEYCTRLLCSQFLLNGNKGGLISDKSVKVSVKSLALLCLADIFRYCPQCFVIDLNINGQLNETVQKVWDVVLYSSHSDPHLRGQVAILIGNFTSQVLSTFPSYNDFLIKSCSVASFAEAPTLEEIVTSHLLSAIFDSENSSVCIRHGLIAMQKCLIPILQSNEALNSVSMNNLYKLLSLKNHNYWLVKVEVLELLSKLPFTTIHYLENYSKNQSNNSLWTSNGFETMVLNKVFLQLLSDDDHRVRQAASNCLVRIIPVLFIPEKNVCNDAVTAVASEMISSCLKSFWTSSASYTQGLFPNNVLPSNYGFAFPFCDKENTAKYSDLLNSNLKRVVTLLMNHLMVNTDNKSTIYGICSALSDLSDSYVVTKFPDAWGCDMNSSTNCLQFVKFLLALLTSNSVVYLELTTHQSALNLLGNLISGLCYQSLKSSVLKGSSSNDSDLEWCLISKDHPALVSLLELMTTHLLKVLNLYTSVVEENNPFRTNVASNSNSSSKAPVITSLSPIRKKSVKNDSEKNESKKSLNEKEKEKTKNSFTRQNSFSNDPMLCKLFETLRSIHFSSKISMDMSRNKISYFLETVLNVFSQILEVGTLKYFGKYGEELLDYLKVLIVVEPSACVVCVRQLLKCIFGTNFSMLLTTPIEADSESNSEKERKSLGLTYSASHYAFPLSSNIGLYQTCIASPYAQFSQYYTSKSHGTTQGFYIGGDDTESWHCFYRKNLEKRFSSILDKVTIKNNSPQNNSKLTLTTHIRLFEPVVIKALKLYTITSDTKLQCDVLNLLSQLVRLRVNYCLLDADQIFVGFVQKQFEYVESGQMVNVSQLINQIFQFLVLLSYERYHSKPIISVPKIIQMCDNLMACGELPTDCVIPALIPFAEDLFLHRGPSKVDSVKELEAQREVLTATLLKLINFPKVIEIFITIIVQSRKEGDEKWRKISRQVMDAILPLLMKQQINIDDYHSLDIVHRLFEAVSPVVFRPVDYLLNVLFSHPLMDFKENDCLFHRWISTILVILKVLCVQAKEEVVLARLEDLQKASLQSGVSGKIVDSHLTFQIMQMEQNSFSGSVNPEKLFAEFLLNVVQLSVNQYRRNISKCNPHLHERNIFLGQQISCYLLYLTHMCQSGSYRRVAKCVSNMIKKPQNSFDIDGVNTCFSAIELQFPTLSLQWCNILMILGYDDNGTHEFWYKLVKRSSNSSLTSPERNAPQSGKQNIFKMKHSQGILSVNCEILRRGALILLCDFVCENMNDAEQLTWLMINNIRDIIRYSYELPIRDFIHSVHRNQASSGLFLQAINARCDDSNDVAFLKRLLYCVEVTHTSQSGALVSLLIEQIITNPLKRHFVSLKLQATEMALKKLESLMKLETVQEMEAQLSTEDTNKLINLTNKYKEKKLFEALSAYKLICTNQLVNSHPLIPQNRGLIIEADKDWFLTIITTNCKHRSHYKELAPTLAKLSYEDLSSMFEKKFDLSILSEFIEIGSECVIEKEDKVNPKNAMFSAVLNRNIILKFSINSALNYLNQIHNYLPQPHFPFLSYSEAITPKEAKHRDKLIDLFNDKSFTELLCSFGQVYTAFIKHAESTKCFTLNPDTMKLILRIGVLYAEVVHWEVEKGSIEYLNLYLSVIDSFFQCDSLLQKLNNPENISFQCSLIASTHCVVQYYHGDLREVKAPKNFQESELVNPEWKHGHKACIRVAELVMFLEEHEHNLHNHFPLIISDYFYRIIISLSRLNLVNTFVLVPPNVWKQNLWSPDFSGDFGTICSTIRTEYLRDGDLLKQFIFRVKLIGWTKRSQFEEMWMSLFSVVQSENSSSNDEQNEKLLTACMAANGITLLLLEALMVPEAGNPLRSTYLRVKHSKPVSFLHTKYGEKLLKIKCVIAEKYESYNWLNFHRNQFSFGLVSVEYLRSQVGTQTTTDVSPSLSSGSSSSSSSTTNTPTSAAPKILEPSLLSDSIKFRDSLEIDINSSIYFLLEIYGQLINSPHTQSPLLVEVCKSIAYLSDLFFDKSQFEWMLDTFLELFRLASTSEDEIHLQFLSLGVCKAAAVLSIEQDQMIEKCKKCVESCLKSSFLPTRLNTLYGLWYLLEQRNTLSGGKETLFLPIISDYLLKHLSDETLPSSHNEEHVTLMWKFAFHLIEYFVDDFAESDFGQKIFQMALKTLSTNNVSFNVYHTIINGLERLLVCEVFAIKDAESIIKTAMDKIKFATTKSDAIGALSMMFTALYVFGLSLGNENDETANIEELLSAMEKIAVIFDRLKVCTPNEASIICAVIPALLCDFFPTQDVLNKIIGEFISSQQVNRKYLSSIIFQVFNNLHQQSKELLIHDWVVLSISSFTQIVPISLAVWTLSCFLISASSNMWIRSIFACVQQRIDKFEEQDKDLFLVVCCTFFDELKNEDHKKSYIAAFETASLTDSVYSEVLTCLQAKTH